LTFTQRHFEYQKLKKKTLPCYILEVFYWKKQANWVTLIINWDCVVEMKFLPCSRIYIYYSSICIYISYSIGSWSFKNLKISLTIDPKFWKHLLVLVNKQHEEKIPGSCLHCWKNASLLGKLATHSFSSYLRAEE
jgi:hypothetical protein